MFNQNRIYRLFQLINHLKSEPYKSNQNLAILLGITGRSVYRYMDLLQEMGIKIEKDMNGKYFIPGENDNKHVFTTQETEYLTMLLQTVGKSNPLNESIYHKIRSSSEIELGVQTVYNAHLAKIVESLSLAIQEKKQVWLKGYYSASSQTIADRLVEPMCFTENYSTVSAYEIASASNKLFSIERISEVQVLNSDFAFEPEHKYYKPDIFGFQGKKDAQEVEWNMSLRASLLLKEEYPMSLPYIKPIPNTNQYQFKAPVHSFKGPVRFVMGFLNEIEVLGSDKFMKYLKRLKKGKG